MSRMGNSLFRLAILVLVSFALIGGIYRILNEARQSMVCRHQLEGIYQALELYEMSHGALPRLAFFPDEPMTDADSIRLVLEAYGLDHSSWICPAAHPAVASTGLTYLWNTRLSGVDLRTFTEPQWMMVEINALSADVPAPHLGHYNVLYSDGQVVRVGDPQSVLRGL